MYLRDMWASLLRRWYLVLIACVLVSGVGWITFQKVAPTYEMSASVLLVPPKSPDDPQANRYLGLSGLGPAVSVVIRALNSDQTNSAVDVSEPKGEYLVTTDLTTSAPIVVIDAKGDSASIARNLTNAVVEQVPLVLQRLQADLNISQSARITSLEVTRDQEPSVLQKKRIRIVAVVTVFLLGLMAVMIGAVDGILMRRRGEAQGRPRHEAVGGVSESSPPTKAPDSPRVPNGVARRPAPRSTQPGRRPTPRDVKGEKRAES